MKQVIMIYPSGEVERRDVPDGELSREMLCEMLGRAPGSCRRSKIGRGSLDLIMAASGEWNVLADTLLSKKASTYGPAIVVENNANAYGGMIPAMAAALAKSLVWRRGEMEAGRYACLEGTEDEKGKRYGIIYH